MSLISLWVGLGLSFVVAVVSTRAVATTFDAKAIAAAKMKEKTKEKNAATAAAGSSAPFGGVV